ncbi:MAG: hypothetical protein HY706_21300 [Candidatus Hydrogenedentes bacterium]|nr:hypothetical protein [Candidatus Hydrogenedentota bacterium]
MQKASLGPIVEHSVIVVYPNYDAGWNPVATPFSPITFSGVDVVVRSNDPADENVVAACIIQGTSSLRCVTFDGDETADCALIGFTIKGGHQSPGSGILGATNGSPTVGTKARIEYNVIYGNGTASTGNGGAIAYCHGLIHGNIIGKAGSGNANLAQYGGGLYVCNGTIRRNKIWYNTASAAGGGLYNCDGTFTSGVDQFNQPIPAAIAENYIAHNTAYNGGGMAACDARIRSNLIYANTANGQAGGMYNCDAIALEQNTIVSNTAPGGTGKMGGLWGCNPGLGPAPDYVSWLRNNIIYYNTAGGATTGKQLDTTSSTPEYCCIQEWSGNGRNNIVADPAFRSNYPIAPWEEFLHLKNKKDTPPQQSPCVDAGYTETYTDQQGKTQLKRFYDFDHQASPIDGTENGTIERDIGADEAPTPPPGSQTYWWEIFGPAPEP